MDFSHLRSQYHEIQQEIIQTCIRCGRSPSEVRVMAVTKGQPVEKMLELCDLGQRLFGESRLDEAQEKKQKLPHDAEIHMIGQLQSNKACKALFFDCIHSIDRPSLVQKINQCPLQIKEPIPVLVEVNTSREASKAGVKNWQEMRHLLEIIRTCSKVHVQGLMTIAPMTTENNVIRDCFSALRSWKERLCLQEPEFCWNVLSMGMSNDFCLAIEEGSTLVRIGTRFFEN